MTRHHTPKRLAPPFRGLLLSAGCVLVCPGVTLAQDADTVTIDARRCMDLTAPDERLACFEAQVRDARGHDGANDDGPRARPPPIAETAPPREAAPARNAEPATARELPPTPARESPPGPARESAPAEEAAADRQAQPAPARQAARERDARERDADAPQSTAETEIVATVAALSQRLPNQHVITLENGQVWRQRVPEQYPIRVGQQVRISSGRWGGGTRYRLEAENVGGFIQVDRMR